MRTILVIFLLAAVMIVAGAETPATDTPHPKGYVCYHADKPVVIDGTLDDAAWATAPWTDDFVDIEGGLKPAPRFKTQTKMAWDNDYFYIAAELSEPQVWGTLVKRDTVIFHDNDFEVFIDPDGDSHEYYEFEMNALNTVWDLLLVKPYRDGGPAVDGWDIAGLKSAVHVNGTINNPADTDQSWTVEIAMPWSSLADFAHRACPPQDGDQWRVNFSRVEWQTNVVNGAYQKVEGKREDNWVWSPQWVVDMHRPELWGYVQFSTSDQPNAIFVADPKWEARNTLYKIYWAEKSFHEKNKKWAPLLKDLTGFAPVARDTIIYSYTYYEGYKASIMLPTEGGKHYLNIREDSRIWETPGPK